MRDAGQAAERLRPQAGAQRDGLAGDLALLGAHARDPAALDPKPGHGAVLDDPHALLAGALGQRLRDVGRVGLAVGRQERRADQVGGVHQRPEILRLAGREQVHLEPEAARGGRLAPDLDQAIGVAREAQAAVPLPAGGLPGLGLEALVQLDRMLSSWVTLALVRSWPTSPAACQVEPEVSRLRSSSTTSCQPARAR